METKIKDQIIADAILLQLKGNVKQIGDGTSNLGFIWEVNDHIVRIYKKAGRCIIDCDCKNCSRFCSTNGTLCKYKLSAIMEYIKIFR